MELIVFDLDGTLLNRESEISDYTSETLKLLAEKGIAYTVATGRAMHSAQAILADHRFLLPQAYKNGVMSWHPEQRRLAGGALLTVDELDHVVQSCIRGGVTPFVFTFDDGDESVVYHSPLRTGIEMSHAEGFNPYRFGVIGSSDSHNASSSVEEDNHHGKLPILDGSPATRLRTNSLMPQDMPGGTIWSAAGLAAVWAEENTRESLFEAMRRKETFATSGPRIQVRFFGGWDYPEDLLAAEDWIAVSETTGVPMGGDLSQHASATAPTFVLWAIRDPLSGNLDRLQIIKGWMDQEGETHEKVYDVAWSSGRKPGSDGKLPAVGNTVDVENATWTNTIGAPELIAVWKDPDFDPQENAFYYARVIEIPTPRWTAYDAFRFDIKLPDDVPMKTQERAYTSPIWYTPAPDLVKKADFYPGLQEKLRPSSFDKSTLKNY